MADPPVWTLEALKEHFDHRLTDAERSTAKAEAAVLLELRSLHSKLDALDTWRAKATAVFLVLVPLAGVIGAAVMKALGG